MFCPMCGHVIKDRTIVANPNGFLLSGNCQHCGLDWKCETELKHAQEIG